MGDSDYGKSGRIEDTRPDEPIDLTDGSAAAQTADGECLEESMNSRMRSSKESLK